MEHRIRTEEKKLKEFIEMLVEDRYLIPAFQRDFVWEPAGIIKLWDSLYRFYPIGSILCWESDILLNIYRKLGGYIFQNSMEKIKELGKWVYILDGQQRATSLLVSIFGGEGKIRNRTELFNYRMYFDAAGGAFFFENELGRRRQNINPFFLIPLQSFYNGSNFTDNIMSHPECTQRISENLRQLTRALNEYMIPVIHIRGFDIPSVCEIFERINKEGKELKSSDITIARTFKNYKGLVEEDM